ncbi:competence protein CoiA [Microbacterium sp. NPDC058062]|uniref:competence protein CoiA n=1 Tax=Microbacterium sp. NPDC058062 TaxID=3346320 RepID=UPI0036DED3F3
MAIDGTETIASFTSGDPRFIYAARRDGTGVMLLPEGEAEQHRHLARTELMCPVRGCPAPDITTVGGERRHHYRHLVKNATTDHGAETWYHLEAKHVLASWASVWHEGAVVEIERVLGSRDRVADVFVGLPDGTQYAIEVQFSSLTPELFRERHRWYRDAGIVDVWLFIHAGVHLRTGWNDTRDVTYSPTHRAVRYSGVPVLWLNPQQQMVGYATRTLTIGTRTYRTHVDDGGEFAVEPLANFSLKPAGMSSAVLTAIDVDTADALDAIERAGRARAAADERRRQDIERRAHATQRAAESARVSAGERNRKRAAIAARWESSPEGQAAYAYFGGLMLPLWLIDDGELEVTIPGRVWKWRLVRELVLPLCKGQYLTSPALLHELGRTYPEVFPARATEREIDSLLRELEAEGLLNRVVGQPGYYTAVDANVAAARSERDVPTGMCSICRKPLSKDIPGMKVHFGDCERRAANLARRSPAER